jgi:uncharacterized protein YpiB (UPF0302 family)
MKLLVNMEKGTVIITEFELMGEFESIVDIDDMERAARKNYENWSQRWKEPQLTQIFHTWLPIIMYVMGIIHYSIEIPITLSRYAKERNIELLEKDADKIAYNFLVSLSKCMLIDPVIFQRDTEDIKKEAKGIILEFLKKSKPSRESIQTLSDRIFTVTTARWNNVEKGLIEYIVEAELSKFRRRFRLLHIIA